MRKVAALVVLLTPLAADAQEVRFVGNSVMFSEYRIIRSLLDSRDLTSFARSVRAVRLDQPFLKPGAVTVFAPTNEAFASLSPDLQDRLVKHPAHDEVARVLACHIVTDPRFAGKKLSDLMNGKDTITLPTLGGCDLTVTRDAKGYHVASPLGVPAGISAADIEQSNGMIEIIDAVILPSR